MLLSDIDTWNVGALRSIAHELGDELTTIEGVASGLELISRLPGWDSPAADAARGKIHQTTGKVLDDAAVIGAVQQLASETAGAVAKLQPELESVRADVSARGGYLTLSDNGDVTINAPPDMRDELRPIADSIESRAKALIRQAEDIDADCPEVFGHVENGDITARGATDVPSAQEMGRDQSGLSAPYPPEGEGVMPEDVTAWWNALSTEEHDKIKAEHPDWIGDRDGVPTPFRRRSTRTSSTANSPMHNVPSTTSRPSRSTPAQEPADPDPRRSAASVTGWWRIGSPAGRSEGTEGGGVVGGQREQGLRPKQIPDVAGVSRRPGDPRGGRFGPHRRVHDLHRDTRCANRIDAAHR
jgi:hypothetical protein